MARYDSNNATALRSLLTKHVLNLRSARACTLRASETNLRITSPSHYKTDVTSISTSIFYVWSHVELIPLTTGPHINSRQSTPLARSIVPVEIRFIKGWVVNPKNFDTTRTTVLCIKTKNRSANSARRIRLIKPQVSATIVPAASILDR